MKRLRYTRSSYQNQPRTSFQSQRYGQKPGYVENANLVQMPNAARSPKFASKPTFVKNNTTTYGRGDLTQQFQEALPTRKVDLLTTMTQMIYLFYPMEGIEVECPSNLPPIMRTKEQYSIVNDRSPLFFLDTEMCLTEADLLELTRVTLVIFLSCWSFVHCANY